MKFFTIQTWIKQGKVLGILTVASLASCDVGSSLAYTYASLDVYWTVDVLWIRRTDSIALYRKIRSLTISVSRSTVATSICARDI